MERKIKLRESIYILEESEEIYQVIFTGTRRIKKFQVDGLVKKIINELNVEQEINLLIDKLSKEYEKQKITKCLESLEHAGILRSYNPDMNERHSKQLLFIDELTNSWEESINLQRKIEDSVISVFGVGGIGTWIVNGLYQIGVGEIRITDPDTIEKSNLGRQLYFTEKDIGKLKVETIREKLPDANIKAYTEIVSQDGKLEEIIVGSNFLVNCADNPSVEETTRLIDKYANKYNIPYCIAGGYNMHLGMIGPIIIPGKTASFNEFLEYQRRKDPLTNLKVIKDIGQTGNLGPIAGAVANIQLMEIFKYLIGKGKVNLNKFAEIDFLDFTIEWREFSNLQSKVTLLKT